MPFVKVALKPGIFRDGTRYSAEGTWYDCDKIRFRKGYPEKIGGWRKYSPNSHLGSTRNIHDWGTVDGGRYIALGTHLKLYVVQGDNFYDVTPIASSQTLGADPLAVTDTTAVVVVTDVEHGLTVGAYVVLSGATGPVGGIPASDFNQEHRVQSIVDADSYRIVVDTPATSTVAAGGGSVVVATYDINPGLDVVVPSSGWGAGTWSSGNWGGATEIGPDNSLRVWSLDNYGDDLVSCVRQGGVYYWDQSGGTGAEAVPIHELTRRSVTVDPNPITTVDTSATITITDIGGHGAGVGDTVVIAGSDAVNGIPANEINASHTVVSTPTSTTFTVTVTTVATATGIGGGSLVTATYEAGEYYTPTFGLQAMVSDVARHIIVFGTTDIGATTIDPLLVRWCESENAAEWEPKEENAAGGQRLSNGSQFVGALRTRQEIIIWTDVNMVSMRYVGQPFIFSFNEISANVSMLSQNAAIVANGIVFFMDRGGFYTYSGRVERLPCPVRDYIFSDMDLTFAPKVTCGTNVDFSEVVWLYPSTANNGEIDKYVMFNYDENAWSYGTLERGYWSEAPTRVYPLATSVNKTVLGDNPVETTNTSGTITITQTAHGMDVGDIVILSGIAAVGGLSINVLNSDYPVAGVPDANSYTITLPDLATSSTTGGGSNVQVLMPNYLYDHEIGHDADGEAMNAYIESGDMDIEEGDHFWFMSKLIPDVQFRGSTSNDDSVVIDLYGHDYPGGARTRRTTSEVNPDTTLNYIRMRSRLMSLKAESTGAGYGWRLGYPRLDARKDGKR